VPVDVVHDWIFGDIDPNNLTGNFIYKFLTQKLQLKNVSIDQWTKNENGLERRALRYVMDLKQTMGSKETNVLNVQRYLKKAGNEGHCIVENSSETPEVPNGDCFRTLNLYSLSYAGPNKCRLIVSGAVTFHKSTWIKGFIESHAMEGSIQFVRDLNSTLKEAVQKTNSSGTNTPVPNPNQNPNPTNLNSNPNTPVKQKSGSIPNATNNEIPPSPSSNLATSASSSSLSNKTNSNSNGSTTNAASSPNTNNKNQSTMTNAGLVELSPDRPTIDPFSIGYEPLKTHSIDKVFPMSVEKLHDWIFGENNGNMERPIPRLLQKRLKYKSLWFHSWKKGDDGSETREYGYIMDLNGPIGPKFTNVTNSQRYIKKDVERGHYIIENTSTTPDVPSGDCFKTINLYSLSHVSGGQSRLVITGVIIYLKPTWIKTFIETHGTSGFVQYARDLDVTITETLAMESASKSAPSQSNQNPSSSAESTPATKSILAPASQTGRVDDTKETTPENQASAKEFFMSKFHYYRPFFEILSFLLLVLFINVFVFVRLNGINTSVRSLNDHIVNKEINHLHDVDLLINSDANAQFIISKYLVAHSEILEKQVNSLTNILEDTHVILNNANRELDELKKTKYFLQKGLYCLAASPSRAHQSDQNASERPDNTSEKLANEDENGDVRNSDICQQFRKELEQMVSNFQ